MKTLVPVTSFDSPVKTVNGEQIPADLFWQFNLPPNINEADIKVNFGRLLTMHRIGGIAMSAVASFQGDQTEFTPGIAGVNSDGSALATRAGITKKAEPDMTASTDAFSHLLSPIYGQVIATHRFNKTEMSSRVSDAVKEGKTRESAYADQLDVALRRSIKKVGRENLLDRDSTYTKAVWLCYSALIGAASVDSAPDTVSIYTLLYGLKIVSDSIHNKLAFDDDLLRQRRWSVVSCDSYQPDRYLALAALCALPGLISAKK